MSLQKYMPKETETKRQKKQITDRVLLSSLRNDRDMARSLAKRLDKTIKILEEEEHR